MIDSYEMESDCDGYERVLEKRALFSTDFVISTNKIVNRFYINIFYIQFILCRFSSFSIKATSDEKFCEDNVGEGRRSSVI